MARNGCLVDPYGRRIHNLRISITDRCNFRCVYCTPEDGYAPLPEKQHMSLDEIARVVRLAGQLDVRRYRLTGGEPLLRSDVVDIVRTLKTIDTTRELSITTNASRLSALAGPLRAAGLDRLNISLDSLDPARFQRVSRTTAREYERARAGVEAALDAGFPVKLNMVVLAGISDDEIIEFVRLAAAHDIDVRFLEFMPLCGSAWEAEMVHPIGRVREVVRRSFTLLELPRGGKTAQTFAIAGGRGRVGFIGSLSEPFCSDCSRMRLTADGRIRPCLFSSYEVPILHLLRNGAQDEQIIAAFRLAIANKPAGNPYLENHFGSEGDDRPRVANSPFIRSVGG